MRKDNYNEIDPKGLRGEGLILAIDGKKGEFTREWGTPDPQTYEQVDPECEKRLMDFVHRNTEEKKPFFISYWPNLMDFSPPAIEPKKSYNGGTMAEALVTLDGFIGELMDELEKLGIAENTLLVVMADNAFLLSPFTTISLVPDGGLNWNLVRQLGYRRPLGCY